MRKLRSMRKLLAAVKISSGNTITSGDAVFQLVLFLGAMSMFAGSEDSETVKKICLEAERRGRLLSKGAAKCIPYKKSKKKTVTWTPFPP